MTMTSKARRLKSMLNREKKHATLKELKLLLTCFYAADFKAMYNTRLYNQYGAEYCGYLEIIDLI